jgi:hypothetical protein
MTRRIIGLCVFLAFSITVENLDAAISAQLTPSIASPSQLGSVITWTVEASDTSPGQLWYRFRSAPLHGSFAMIRDFAPQNQLDWTTIDGEGVYVIEAAIRNQSTGETIYTSVPYEMDSRVVDDNPVINPTANPLVFLYSAPACPEGGNMYVSFWPIAGPFSSNVVVQPVVTDAKACDSQTSMNFYLAGLRADTNYQVSHTTLRRRRSFAGPILAMSTGSISTPTGASPFPKQTVQASPFGAEDSLLLQGTLNGMPIATDLQGNILWYYPKALSYLTHPEQGGHFFGIFTGSSPSTSLLREFDLAGNTIKETNAATVNAQLAALGKRQIGVFHHDARFLSNGNIATIGTVEQMLTDVQGPGTIDVIGDMLIVLDPNLQVVWTWDAFDHLDVTRTAVLGETCSKGGACQSHFLAPDGNDWTHANAVSETPDGNLLFSLRHQDWVLKVNYDNGKGDGQIVWRLGPDGDFTIQSADAFPWFSHQHDVNFLPDNSTLTLFDNGNTRKTLDPSANSRGQVLRVDQQNFTVSHILNADLGVFSAAVGSAQKLGNGDYHFDAGFVDNNSAISLEVDPSGKARGAIRASALEYRTFRLSDLYKGVPVVLPLDESQGVFGINRSRGPDGPDQRRQ